MSDQALEGMSNHCGTCHEKDNHARVKGLGFSSLCTTL